jgi:Flp pilus assembly protein TadD
LGERAQAHAVNLDPRLVDAWNELGESYWKAGDVENARTCFEGALAHVSMGIIVQFID